MKSRIIRDTLFPINSRRRLFAKLLLKAIHHPIRFLKCIDKGRIRLLVKGLNSGDIASLIRRTDYFLGSPIGVLQKPDILPIVDIKGVRSAPLLNIPSSANPLVSIIIPVCNKFCYTYACLKSIALNSDDVEYEVIIADDCSTDLTTKIESFIGGVKRVVNECNTGFLKNCNHAAEIAKGKYLLFLNNDTQVQKGWLKPLIDLIESNEKIGMVGSKLICPDGRLQEAGGIVWKDASAWNFGRCQNPDQAEFNYVREVDYISGASIMIRKNLWKEIGGFDERFAPAYYEDTDLAFEVRKHGYTVVFQPASIVVHFEGVSNGNDLSIGMKSYQVVNQKKFYEKWKQVLEKEQFSDGENVQIAKDRSRLKKRILVIDHHVPFFDQDAGSRCTYMYLQIMLKMGMHVTFIGDNYYRHEPYTTDLTQKGVEVLYGNYYYNHWKEWLIRNLHYYDYVYLQRPHISIKYIDLVKQYSNAKVFYFAHDLHHLREMRQYELTNDPHVLESAERIKKIEYELFEKADVIHVVGSFEQAIVQKEFPAKPVRNIPLFLYDNIPEVIEKDFSKRGDLLFVGGFAHTPNIDAVLWFAENVFPSLQKTIPRIKWFIVGGNAPQEVYKLDSESIIVKGFISDDELHKLYCNCRMTVVPLRYGAGVKGKVVESAYYQIPLVTTSIGAEGIDSTVGNMLVVDDTDEMIKQICDLYNDFDRLREMSDAGVNLIKKYYTVKEAERILRLDL